MCAYIRWLPMIYTMAHMGVSVCSRGFVPGQDPLLPVFSASVPDQDCRSTFCM